MPHTNRKKKSTAASPADKTSSPKPRITHTKRQQVADEEGWTHVVDAPTRKAASTRKLPLVQGGDPDHDGRDYVTRTIEQVREDFEFQRRSWGEGEACTLLRTKLEGRGEQVRIENVVCLGLGSLQSFRREGRRASGTQLAALRTMIEILAPAQTIPCIFQDPQFTALDKEFLTSLGYTVVDHPEAFTKITRGSLVYGIHCYGEVYRSVSEAPGFAALVCTDVENFATFNRSENDTDTARALREMVKGCDEEDFPQVRYDFSDTKLYWKKTTREEATSKSA